MNLHFIYIWDHATEKIFRVIKMIFNYISHKVSETKVPICGRNLTKNLLILVHMNMSTCRAI
jgi:hypothetical protein